MSEYISREAAIRMRHGCNNDCHKCDFAEEGDSWCQGELFVVDILRLPAADVAPVRHGRWIQKGRKIYCSKCNRGVYIGTDDEGVVQDEMRLRYFCSACGAKMDGGTDDV